MLLFNQVIGALSRSGAAPPPRPAKRHKMQSLSYLEKQVDQVVQSARTRVQKSDVTAHSSSVSSLLFSPKTMFLYSFSFGRGRNGGEAPNLKVRTRNYLFVGLFCFFFFFLLRFGDLNTGVGQPEF